MRSFTAVAYLQPITTGFSVRSVKIRDLCDVYAYDSEDKGLVGRKLDKLRVYGPVVRRG